jgi:hypothetical protein
VSSGTLGFLAGMRVYNGNDVYDLTEIVIDDDGDEECHKI